MGMQGPVRPGTGVPVQVEWRSSCVRASLFGAAPMAVSGPDMRAGYSRWPPAWRGLDSIVHGKAHVLLDLGGLMAASRLNSLTLAHAFVPYRIQASCHGAWRQADPGENSSSTWASALAPSATARSPSALPDLRLHTGGEAGAPLVILFTSRFVACRRRRPPG